MGVGSWESGVGSRESGVGSRESGVRDGGAKPGSEVSRRPLIGSGRCPFVAELSTAGVCRALASVTERLKLPPAMR